MSYGGKPDSSDPWVKPSTDSHPSAERIAALTPRADLPRHLRGVLLPLWGWEISS
jgi:hypothetical protein